MTQNNSPTTPLHQPVMTAEVLDFLQVKPDHWYLDATFGRGGHTQAILQQQGKVVALDVDQEAIKFGQQQFAQDISANNLILINSNFAQLKDSLTTSCHGQTETASIHGIVFDLGTSQDQIKAPHRGFSFDHPQDPLDMRLDQSLGVTAADLLAVLSSKQLEELFRNYGGENKAKQIAKAIDRYRGPEHEKRIETVGQLLTIIEQVKQRSSHLHPATKVFQALRIAVNSELDSLKQALPQALEVLTSQGRLVTIAFHQGEDVIVKQQFKEWEQAQLGEIITKKPVQPDNQEKTKNPSARSAKLRAFEKK